MRRLCRPVTVLFVALVMLWPTLALAQATKAGVVTTLEGSATAARSSLPQPVALKFKDDIFQNDRIVTGDRSIVRMLLGGKAVVTVRERSSLTITEVPGKSTIDLDNGKIAVAVAKDRMRPGESIEVKTPNAVAAVRGTVFVIEVIRATASADAAQGTATTNFYGFAGSVLLNFNGQLFNLLGNNFASGTGSGPVNSGNMTAAMRLGVLAGLQPKTPNASGGQDTAKEHAFGSTVTTFNAGLPQIGPPPTPFAVNPPIPPQRPPLLPGGRRSTIAGRQNNSGGSGGFKPGGTPTGILLFGDYPSRDTLASDLPGLGKTFTMNVTTLPSDLSSFGTIWHVGAFAALTSAEQTRLAAFLALGRGLHLTGERPCCDTLNDSITTFVRSVVVGGSGITIGHQGDIGGIQHGELFTYDFNPTARGNITTSPNTLTTWNPSAPGGLIGVAGANVLVTGAGGIVVGAVWDSVDLVHGGRLTLLMDVNWFDNGGRLPVIENIERFIDDPPATLSLAGPLFRSTGEQLDSAASFLAINGYTVTGSGADPLLWFSGSTVTTSGDFVRMTDSAVSVAGSFARLENGAEIIQTSTATPLVSMSGGSLDVGSNLFELSGRPGNTQVDAETGLTLGTDRPLQPGSESPVFEASNATVSVRGGAYRVDTALLEATAPLLNLKNNTTLTTGGHTVDLTGRARISIPNDAVAMVSLNASILNVTGGHLVNVAGGSSLSLAGSLLSLSGGSTVNILNGLLLNVTGGSVATIGRSLVSFTGSGNVLNVANNLVPTALIGGVPVYGPADSFRISGNALAGLGTAGTIKINGVALTPTTPLASLKGSLVAVQGSGTVRVGP